MEKSILAVLVVLSLSVVASAQVSEGWFRDEAFGCWLKPPLNWQKTQLKGTAAVSQRFSESQANAFIEFLARTEDPLLTSENVADAWETDTKKYLPYLEKRLSSESIEIAGAKGVLRSYEGKYYGTLLRAYVLYVAARSNMYVVAGVFVKEKAAVYEKMVKELVLTFRLIAPEPEKIE